MVKKISIFLLFSFFSSLISAQDHGQIDPLIYQINQNNSFNNMPREIKLVFHKITKNDGSGGVEDSDIDIAVDKLNNTYFKDTGISFVNECSSNNIIRSDVAYNRPLVNGCILKEMYASDDALDVFLGSPGLETFYLLDIPLPAQGIAEGVPGKHIIIWGSTNGILSIHGPLLAHEIGHCLGLLHTHQFTDKENSCYIEIDGSIPICPFDLDEPNITGGCAELVNGDEDNRNKCGDCVSDTEADPNEWVEGGCTVNSSCQDELGNSYMPDDENIMAYSDIGCRKHFTAGQVVKMKNTFSSFPEILEMTTSNGTSGCQTCNVPSNFKINQTVTWTELLNYYPHDGFGTYYLSDHIFNLPQNNLSNVTMIIEEDLILDVDYVFTDVDFVFREGGSLEITNGATINILESSTLNACNNEIWNGIRIDENATLVLENSQIKDADVAIRSEGSVISLEGNTIVDCRVGIETVEQTSIMKFEGNTITTSEFGVYIHPETESLITLIGKEDNPNIFNDQETGIYCEDNPIIIRHNEFNNSDKGIEFVSVFWSVIEDNIVDFNEVGIEAKDLSSVEILHNKIGTDFDGSIAIRVDQSVLEASNNEKIRAKSYGILAQSSILAKVNSNNIEISNSAEFGIAGIAHNLSSPPGLIFDNYISADHAFYGIQLESSRNNWIHNNIIENTAGQCISLDGSHSNEILGNLVNNTGGNGISMENAGLNVSQCNDINTSGLGFRYRSNCPEQDIAGNKIEANVDLWTISEIGIQDHRGNEFFGGTVNASSLSDVELQFSIFFVEDIPLINPSNPNPDEGWFLPQADTPINAFEGCTGTIGANGDLIFANDAELCAYVQQLIFWQEINPEYFAINLIQLLQHLLGADGDVPSLPDCVLALFSNFNLCGFEDLNSIHLSNISNVLSDHLIEQEDKLEFINSSWDAYRSNLGSGNRITLENSLIDYKTEFENFKQTRTEDLENILINLESWSCQDEIIDLWNESLQDYIRLLLATDYDDLDDEHILSRSELCPAEYGSLVNRYRAIYHTIDPFHVFDVSDCSQEADPRYERQSNIENKLQVSPNPNNGIFTIQFEESVTEISICNLLGEKIYHIINPNDTSIEIDLSNYPEGVYTASAVKAQNSYLSCKFVLLY